MVCLNNGNEPSLNVGTDCVTEEAEEGYYLEDGVGDAWLETHVISGFRVWQVLLLIGTIFTTVLTFLCCCIRFRIPRTKQEIESDWERREMAREFERRMKRIIGHEEGSKLDLRRALEKVHADVVREEEQKREKEEGGQVKIRIREPSCECNEIEKMRGRRKNGTSEQNYTCMNNHSGPGEDGKGISTTTSSNWRKTGIFARVLFSSSRRQKI